jgi:hypothetical protein
MEKIDSILSGIIAISNMVFNQQIMIKIWDRLLEM